MAPQGHPSACCHGGKRRWRPLVSMWCVAMFKFLKIACCCSMCDCHARIIRWQPVRWLPTVLGCGLGPEAWPRPSPPCRLTACCDGQGGANKHRQKTGKSSKIVLSPICGGFLFDVQHNGHRIFQPTGGGAPTRCSDFRGSHRKIWKRTRS